jgi:hypothetical protein
MEGADAVVSSLSVHHLDGQGKQRLFGAVSQRLSARGALLLADLVEPQRPEAHELFAGGWDDAARRQSSGPGGSERAFEQFVATHWNLYRFRFWLRAAHAIYGGYRSRSRISGAPLTFETALATARRALA